MPRIGLPPRPAHRTAHHTAGRTTAVLTAAVLVGGALATAGPAAAGTVARLAAPPPGSTATDAASVDLGAQFTVASTVWAVGVRFYKGTGNDGVHTGTLWSAAGSPLATVTFTAETATGWQRASFPTAVQLSPQTTYTVSYLAPHGHYSSVHGAFANGNTLTAADTVETHGVYAYASGTAFPRSIYYDSNYFVAALTSTKPPRGGTTPPPPPPPSQFPASPPPAGTPAGQVLVPMAGTTITTPGTVVDGRSITGTLTVAADDVVVRNSRISGDGYYGITVVSGSVTITATTITGFENGVTGDRYTADGVEVTGLLADGFTIGSDVTIENSWCHDLTPEPGAHSDCGQVQAGIVNATIRGNWFDPDSDEGNSALFLAPSLGPSSPGPLTVTGNVLGGGNYTLYCVAGDYGRYVIGNTSITGNEFLRDGRYGPTDVNVPVTWSGNTWHDTGAPLTLD